MYRGAYIEDYIGFRVFVHIKGGLNRGLHRA